MISNGQKVKCAYTLKIAGEEPSNETQIFTYTHGKREIISVLEEGLKGLEVGEKKTIKILSKDDQIPHNPQKVRAVSKSLFKNEHNLEIGKRVELKDHRSGKYFSATITDIKKEYLVVDFNHPLAGKDAEFNIQVLSIES